MTRIELELLPNKWHVNTFANIISDLYKVSTIYNLLIEKGYSITEIVKKCKKSYMGLNVASINIAHNHIRYIHKGGTTGLSFTANQCVKYDNGKIYIPTIGAIPIGKCSKEETEQLERADIKKVSVIRRVDINKFGYTIVITLKDKASKELKDGLSESDSINTPQSTKEIVRIGVEILFGHIMKMEFGNKPNITRLPVKTGAIYRFDGGVVKDGILLLPQLDDMQKLKLMVPRGYKIAGKIIHTYIDYNGSKPYAMIESIV